MRAKLVNESFRDILKPKSKEQIISDLNNLKINSFDFYSFLNLDSNIKYKDEILDLCNKHGINAKEMNISNLKNNDEIEKVFNKYLNVYNFDEYVLQSYKDSWGIKIVKLSLRFLKGYPIIKLNKSLYNYYIFPKHNFSNIFLKMAEDLRYIE